MRIACVFVPDLSLQAAQRAHEVDGDLCLPHALVEPGGGPRAVVSCNEYARKAGVRTGMRTTTAQTLCSDLILMEHSPEQPLAALEALADGLGVCSPKVFLSPPDAVFVDLMGLRESERIVERALVQCASELGFRVQVATANRPFSARALARVNARSTLCEDRGEIQALASLPLAAARLPLAVQDALHVVGVRTLGEFVALPPAAVARRFGATVRTVWQQASGRSDLPLPPYRPQRPVVERIVPDDPVERLDQLAFCLKILIDRVLHRVKGRGRALEELRIDLQMASGTSSEKTASHRHTLDLGRPTTDGGLLLQIFRERFAASPPNAPVEGLELQVIRDAPLGAVQLELFTARVPIESPAITAIRLTSLLQGEEGFWAVLRADYRPEQAYALVPFDDGAVPSSDACSPGERPLRLFPSPRRLSTLSPNDACPQRGVVSGPERLQGGWWDGRPITRDYWVIENDTGARSWIFRDRRSGTWYVHGVFD